MLKRAMIHAPTINPMSPSIERSREYWLPRTWRRSDPSVAAPPCEKCQCTARCEYGQEPCSNNRSWDRDCCYSAYPHLSEIGETAITRPKAGCYECFEMIVCRRVGEVVALGSPRNRVVSNQRTVTSRRHQQVPRCPLVDFHRTSSRQGLMIVAPLPCSRGVSLRCL